MNWKVASTINTNFNDVFLPLNPQAKTLVTDKLIEKSFFLPRDVLVNPDYSVSPIVCMGHDDFATIFELLMDKDDISVFYDCDYLLISYAKLVGISARKHLLTGKLYVIFKLWYGAEPADQQGKGFSEQYELRKHQLYTLLNI